MSQIGIERRSSVAIVEMRRPPDNYFDLGLIRDIADAFDDLDDDPGTRCILLCSEGRNFCAGANFQSAASEGGDRIDPAPVYWEALRLFRVATPVVAAVQGGAIGGGLGLALAADFRVATAASRFSANFNRLGIHPGFGLSVTAPRLLGAQRAAMLFYTGRRLKGDEALAIGLVDQLADEEGLREAALSLCQEIAASAPLAVVSTRRTLRQDLVVEIAAAIEHEMGEQRIHFATADFREGVRAMTERRAPDFTGR